MQLRLRYLEGHLLAFGRLAPGELWLADLVVITYPITRCRVGVVHVRWAYVKETLARSLGGWVATRVAPDLRLVSPAPSDIALARTRLSELGVDWTVGVHEKTG